MKVMLLHGTLLVALLSIVSIGQSRAELPPDAQEVIKKGIIAAKEQDYLLAIRFFQDARTAAPDAPEIYYDLGLAESKIPGRELRAIAWFGAYLAANPGASNAAAVKDQIETLDVKNQSNLSRLILTVQEAAGKITSDVNHGLPEVAGLWAETGDLTAALKTAELIQDTYTRSYAQKDVADAQVRAGDLAGAKKTLALALNTADLMHGAQVQGVLQKDIADAQAEAGDIAAALKTADAMQDIYYKSLTQTDIAVAQVTAGNNVGATMTLAAALKTADLIVQNAGAKALVQIEIAEAQQKTGDIAAANVTLAAAIKTANLQEDAVLKGNSLSDVVRAQVRIVEAQLKAGDITGAQTTADLIQGEGGRSNAQKAIADAKAKSGSTSNAASTVSPTIVAQAPVRPDFPVIKASDWIRRLDSHSVYGDCELNTDPFLDLAGYLKSRQSSDDPAKVFATLRSTAETLIKAHNEIEQMLKQQAKS